MRWIRDDGGRADAGFKGTANDCVCRAIAIATGKPYREVYDELNWLGKSERTGLKRTGNKWNGRRSSARTGVYKATIRRYMAALGWTWHPTMAIGQGTKVHLKDGEIPMGRLVVSVSRHSVAVIDGVIHDLGDPSRDGTRCVYGYWSKA